MRIINACLCSVAALVVACGGDKGTTEPRGTLEGTYALMTVAGHQLPYLVESADGSFTIVAGQLTLTASRFTFGLTVRAAGSSQDISPDAVTGSYSRSGDNITFTLPGDVPADDIVMSLHWDGSNQLTPIGDTLPFVFRK